MDRIPITRRGYEALRREFDHLKSVERPKNIKAIEEARAHGDLSENAEFEAAKERQAFIEARVNELGYKLNNAEIIDPDNLPKDKAVFGCRVMVENVETGEEKIYQLVGPDESDVGEGRISIASPLGRAMLGKSIGAEIVFSAPGGTRRFELVKIL